MKKNSPENFETLQVDPISGDYYLVIPEWVANELSWYEDTEISFSVEGDEVILTEHTEDFWFIDNLYIICYDLWCNYIQLWLKDLLLKQKLQ